MTTEQIKLLSKMKKLIYKGNRKFIKRKDRDYIQDLLDIGVSEYEAWNNILSLSSHDYYPDPKPFYYKNSDDSLVFKKYINGELVYIKLKIEEIKRSEMTVCLSFHTDYKKGRI